MNNATEKLEERARLFISHVTGVRFSKVSPIYLSDGSSASREGLEIRLKHVLSLKLFLGEHQRGSHSRHGCHLCDQIVDHYRETVEGRVRQFIEEHLHLVAEEKLDQGRRR